MITSVFAITGWLWYGTVKGNYGFNEFYQDSKEVLYGMKNPTDGVVFTGTRSLTTDREIVRAIEYTNPMVRHFAVSATTEFFKKEQQVTKMKYRTLVQCFAVFKKINTTWNYVNDPNDHEYIAKASESVRLLAGDCDDHSILMAAAIKAIGGTTRLVYTKGHIYPEILAGNKRDFEFVSRMIRTRLFAEETQNKNIHFHKDENGNHWINLDYTGNYPGGKFMGEEVIECIYP